jgi:hypothetical protein
MQSKVKIGDEVWELNTDNLMFSDGTLNQFFERVSGIIDYVGAGLAKANLWHSLLDHQCKQKYIEKFKEFKEDGKSDKTSELSAEGHTEVSDLRKKVIEARYAKDLLQSHLNALNSAREDAHNRGHMLRKEMDKLNMDISSSFSATGS